MRSNGMGMLVLLAPPIIVSLVANLIEIRYNLPWWSSIFIAFGFWFLWFAYWNRKTRRRNPYYKRRF